MAQSAPPNPRFDIASVKPAPPDTALNHIEFRPAGFEANGTFMRNLIAIAYEVPIDSVDASSEVIGARGFYLPAYSISARTAGPVPRATLRLMLRNLIEERFQLKCHKEYRTDEVLALTVSTSGLRIEPVDASRQQQGFGPAPGGFRGCVSMEALASFLSGFVPLRVFNQTGVDGVFDIVLRSPPVDGEIGPPFLNRSRAEERFRDALRGTGLELNRRKMQVEHIVVDSMLITPTGN